MLCFGFVESGKFKHCTKTLQHKMSSGYVYPANSLYICVYVWSRCWYLVPLAFVIHIRRGLVLLPFQTFHTFQNSLPFLPYLPFPKLLAKLAKPAKTRVNQTSKTDFWQKRQKRQCTSFGRPMGVHHNGNGRGSGSFSLPIKRRTTQHRQH